MKGWRLPRLRKTCGESSEKEKDVMEEEEEQAWKSLKRGILELEEEGGCWKEPAKETRNIMVTNNQSGVRERTMTEVVAGGKEEVTKYVKSQEDPQGLMVESVRG